MRGVSSFLSLVWSSTLPPVVVSLLHFFCQLYRLYSQSHLLSLIGLQSTKLLLEP